MALLADLDPSKKHLLLQELWELREVFSQKYAQWLWKFIALYCAVVFFRF